MTHPFDSEAIEAARKAYWDAENNSIKSALTAAWASLIDRNKVDYGLKKGPNGEVSPDFAIVRLPSAPKS